MKGRRAIRVLCVTALTGLLLAACGDDRPAASAAAAAKKPKAAGAAAKPAAAAPAAETTEDAQYVYTYNPVGKRDPFRNPLAGAPKGKNRTLGPAENAACTELLCQYALDELHLVAVVSGDANPMAMLEDREGIGHIVRRNTKIGKAGGKVTQVLRDCIVITSFVQTSDGKAQPVKTEMCVAKDAKAAPVLDLLQGKLRE